MANYTPNATKRKANDIISETFGDLFHDNDLEVLINPLSPDEEKGIDYLFEIRTPDQKHREMFFSQNKGTRAVNFKSYSKRSIITFQLKLFHLNYYYYELNEPLLFLLCDVVSRKIYWHAIQLDTSLERRIIEQQRKNVMSLQIEIDAKKVVSNENLQEIMDAIDASRRAQIVKHKERLQLKANYGITSQNINGQTIIEQLLGTINHFNGFSVLPIKILLQLHPFQKYKTASISGDELSTDNEELFSFLQDISLGENRRYSLPESYGNRKEIHNEIVKILDFFVLHIINHVRWAGKYDAFHENRICLHTKFISSECGCERCTVKKFKYLATQEILTDGRQDLSHYEKLRRAYTHYLIGDMESAYSQYTNLLDHTSYSSEPGIYMICKYNLMHLKRIHRYGRPIVNQHQNSLSPEKENFDLDEILVPPHLRDVFAQLKGYKFISVALDTIDDSLTQIIKLYHSDSLGGSSRNRQHHNLIIEFSRAYNFIEFNLLISNNYWEFIKLVNKTLEAAIAMHMMQNSASTKYELISGSLIDMWIMHAETDHLKYLLKRYNVVKLHVADPADVIKTIRTYINNLSESSEFILEHFENNNYFLLERVTKVMDNSLLLISRLDLTDVHIDDVLSTVIELSKKLKSQRMFPLANIAYVVARQKIGKRVLGAIIDLCFKYQCQRHTDFNFIVTLYLKKCSTKVADELFYRVIGKITIDESILGSEHYFDDNIKEVPNLVNAVSPEIKEKFVKILTDYLDNKFSPSIFYIFTVFDVLPQSETHMKKFADSIPDFTKKPSGNELLTGQKELRNYQLDQFINLLFKFEIPFTADMRKLSARAGDSEYYNWLMNLDGYDYKKFDVYWIVEYGTMHYYKAFKNSKRLMAEIPKALSKKYIEGPAKVYFNELLSVK